MKLASEELKTNYYFWVQIEVYLIVNFTVLLSVEVRKNC